MEGRGDAAESEEEVEGVLLSDILSSEYRPFHLRDEVGVQGTGDRAGG